MGTGLKRQVKGWLGGAASILLAGMFVMADSNTANAPMRPARSDILVLDALKAFGPLQRPSVVFLHDQHTKGIGGDCLTCHPVEEDRYGKERLSLKFKRAEDKDKQSVMDIYHGACVACHKEYRAQQQKAGPVTCGGCHAEKARVVSNRRPIGMDQSLHFRHVRANDNQCERCHHRYDPQTQKLYYAKGQEESCVYCHRERSEENRISLRLAAHISCVSCHRQTALQEKPSGPQECGGCHGPEQQALIAKADHLPRLQRNQPDATLVRVHGKDEAPAAPAERMPAVPFNHKAHEGYSAFCRTCHHASLNPCAQCHTIGGRTEGAGVKLVQAMHQPDAAMSCVGCHNLKKNDRACSGCHAARIPEQIWSSERACKVCHSAVFEKGRPQDQAEAQQRAAELLAARQTEHPSPAPEAIPDITTIGHLTDQFEAVKMPHRRITLKLIELTRDNRLAAAFHTQATTLCQGCHHHSPPSLKPPQCGACHGRTSDALNPARPGLMAAFHEQCFQCHERMGITKPDSRDCTACHARRPAMEKDS